MAILSLQGEISNKISTHVSFFNNNLFANSTSINAQVLVSNNAISQHVLPFLHYMVVFNYYYYYFLLSTFCATHTKTQTATFHLTSNLAKLFHNVFHKIAPLCAKTVPYVVQKKRTLRRLPKCSWVVVV